MVKPTPRSRKVVEQSPSLTPPPSAAQSSSARLTASGPSTAPASRPVRPSRINDQEPEDDGNNSDTNDDDNDDDDDDDDPTEHEIPIYLSHKLAPNLHLFQYPVTDRIAVPEEIEERGGQIAARWKEKSRRFEMEVGRALLSDRTQRRRVLLYYAC